MQALESPDRLTRLQGDQVDAPARLRLKRLLWQADKPPSLKLTVASISRLLTLCIVHNTVLEHHPPIRMLALGQRLEWRFAEAAALFHEPKLQPFRIFVTYEALGGEVRNHDYQADISQFEGVDAGLSSEEEIAVALKSIDRNVDRWTSGIKPTRQR